jgi:feruloyl-CoA synthase
VQQLAVETCGERILFLTGFGATETAPYALARTWHSTVAANIGLPAVGLEMKLVPVEGKLDGRVRGPSITPGYWRRPELTAAAFDEEGFYRLGDAFAFEDADDVSKGLLFEGRTAENFKLSTGTWIHVAPLRAKFLAHCAPLARDIVIAGADRGYLCALVCPDVEACRQIAALPASAGTPDVLNAPHVRNWFKDRLSSFAAASTGSSNRIQRVAVLIEPLTIATGELTDKGSINQRLVIRNRPQLIEELYAPAPPAHIIAIDSR